MLPGTNRYVADRRGWGLLETPPGDYEILVVPQGDQAVGIRIARVTVGPDAVAEVQIDSGVRLSSAAGLDPLRYWHVVQVPSDEIVAQTVDRWGFVPLPPGRYRVHTAIPGGTAESAVFSIDSGKVHALDVAELGIGQIRVTTLERQGVHLLFGGPRSDSFLVIGDNRYHLPEADESGEVVLWLEAEPVAVEHHSGRFVERIDVDLRPGEGAVLEFDAAAIAGARGLSLFRIELAVGAPRPVHLAATDRLSDRALLLTAAPAWGMLHLAPGGAQLRVVFEDGEERHGPLPVGALAEVEIGAATVDDPGVHRQLDLAIEAPHDGSVLEVEAREVTVLGHATTSAAAGVTKIVLVIDVSGSVGDPSGIDLRGEGRVATILEAEIAASLDLLDALLEVEAQSPGTAFALSVVTFSDTAQAVVPLTPLTDPHRVAQLREAVAKLALEPPGGSTYFDLAIETALRVFAADDAPPGPDVLVFVTDGQPTSLVPSIDAAARAGARGVVLHTIGLGPDFTGTMPRSVAYPPPPDSGPAVLATMAAFGAPDGRAWALPRPGDIVALVAELPVLERGDAGIGPVEVANATIEEPAADLEVAADGAFAARVPVRFSPVQGIWMNRIEVRVTSVDGAQHERRTIRVEARGMAEAAAAGQAEREALETLIEAKELEIIHLAEAIAQETAAKLEAEEAVAAASTALAERDAREAARRAEDQEALAMATAEIARIRQEVADAAAGRDTALAALAAVEAELAAAETGLAERRREIDALRAAAPAALEQCVAERDRCVADLDSALSELLRPQQVPAGVQITVPGDVLFDFDRSDVRLDAEKALALAAAYIDRHPRSNLVIEGHTDGLGSADYNLELSSRRAEAVARWLTEFGGIAADRIETVGRGKSEPVAAETTADGQDDPEGRQRNRRVEVLILKDQH